jgi:hypothetical protein
VQRFVGAGKAKRERVLPGALQIRFQDEKLFRIALLVFLSLLDIKERPQFWKSQGGRAPVVANMTNAVRKICRQVIVIERWDAREENFAEDFWGQGRGHPQMG